MGRQRSACLLKDSVKGFVILQNSLGLRKAIFTLPWKSQTVTAADPEIKRRSPPRCSPQIYQKLCIIFKPFEFHIVQAGLELPMQPRWGGGHTLNSGSPCCSLERVMRMRL